MGNFPVSEYYPNELDLEECKSEFWTKSKSNSGTFKHNGTTYTSGSFIMAVSDALGSLEMSTRPGEIAELCGLLNNDGLEIGNQEHWKIFANIANMFNVQIDFYMGKECESVWYTTACPFATFGENDVVLRILIKGSENGNNFEFLEDIDGGFSRNFKNWKDQAALFNSFGMSHQINGNMIQKLDRHIESLKLQAQERLQCLENRKLDERIAFLK